ncbi:MAG: hypothetical protein D6719_10215 [Candidatus Dadabacteria bacterium]|nr:MAG: hypothetical protein D6719_10215 [Candidatus Dadabacteria bacterium]
MIITNYLNFKRGTVTIFKHENKTARTAPAKMLFYHYKFLLSCSLCTNKVGPGDHLINLQAKSSFYRETKNARD